MLYQIMGMFMSMEGKISIGVPTKQHKEKLFEIRSQTTHTMYAESV
jgi:hypothetical protein